jgi:phosphorylase kinase alpha/beta subunit
LSVQIEVATTNVQTLMVYFRKYQQRLTYIIEGQVDPAEIMQRPHIRFDGHHLEEIQQEWNHAQNDALGYFLWFYCQLARAGAIPPEPESMQTIALFPHYFQAICYSQDEDSGHWEEDRKISASSLGVVVAGLLAFKALLGDPRFASQCRYQNQPVTPEFLDELINRGLASLNQILPSESLQAAPQGRRFDAALLFLIYPLQVVYKWLTTPWLTKSSLR